MSAPDMDLEEAISLVESWVHLTMQGPVSDAKREIASAMQIVLAAVKSQTLASENEMRARLATMTLVDYDDE